MKKATFVSLAAMLVSTQAYAQAAETANAMGDKGLYALGLAIMLALGAFGATSAQGKVGAAAMDGLARNPQARDSMFVPMIVVLALIESLFILTWIVANTMSGKI